MGSILLRVKNPSASHVRVAVSQYLTCKVHHTRTDRTLNTDRCHLERFAHESSRLLLRVAAVGVEGLRHRQDYVVHRQLLRLRVRLLRIGRRHACRRCRRLLSASLPGPLRDPPVPHSCHRAEDSFLKQVGGHNDYLGENVKTEAHNVRQRCVGTCSTLIYSYTLQPCGYCLRSLFLCELGGLRRLASYICDKDKITICTSWYSLSATYLSVTVFTAIPIHRRECTVLQPSVLRIYNYFVAYVPEDQAFAFDVITSLRSLRWGSEW